MLGLVLGVIATFAIGAASSPGQVGRYQVAGAGNQGVILDTVAGRAWSTTDLISRSDKSFFQAKNPEKE